MTAVVRLAGPLQFARNTGEGPVERHQISVRSVQMMTPVISHARHFADAGASVGPFEQASGQGIRGLFSRVECWRHEDKQNKSVEPTQTSLWSYHVRDGSFSFLTKKAIMFG